MLPTMAYLSHFNDCEDIPQVSRRRAPGRNYPLSRRRKWRVIHAPVDENEEWFVFVIKASIPWKQNILFPFSLYDNILRPRQNGRCFEDNVFYLFLGANIAFWSEFHRNGFSIDKLATCRHRFTQWIGAQYLISHYPKQYWLSFCHLYVSLHLYELMS